MAKKINPWEEIDLSDYESHMALDSVMQLQAMNEIMKGQFYRYPADSVMIFGVAGGNGLNHIRPKQIRKVYGVDINGDYLAACTERYPELADVFVPIQCDLLQGPELPAAKLLIANLFIEYVGYEAFVQAVQQVSPEYVSCVIQINEDEGFVSDSPYLHVFDGLNAVHHTVDRAGLMEAMERGSYQFLAEEETALPNGKKLLRMDFGRAGK